MRKLISLICCWAILLGATAYAGEEVVKSDCVSPSQATSINGKNKWHLHDHCYTDTDTNTHADRSDPAGVGVDLLLVEGEKLDLVYEYKRDFENNENSHFGVFKTKKALWDIIKDFFNKGE